ncbi:MAG: hypothetical protein V3T03_05195, partial [Candidatus Bipolaricaulota bacterium]
IPVKSGTEHLQLPGPQVQEFERLLSEYRKTMPCLFIAFPHDEIALGGCLAAGRGFVHINAYGDVEPCPFSPYSDRNLAEVSLLEAIQSPLLRSIRESGVKLDETDGLCALWSRKEWVEGLLSQSNEQGLLTQGEQVEEKDKTTPSPGLLSQGYEQGLLTQGEQVEEKDKTTPSPGLLAAGEQVAEDGKGAPSPGLLAAGSRPGDE